MVILCHRRFIEKKEEDEKMNFTSFSFWFLYIISIIFEELSTVILSKEHKKELKTSESKLRSRIYPDFYLLSLFFRELRNKASDLISSLKLGFKKKYEGKTKIWMDPQNMPDLFLFFLGDSIFSSHNCFFIVNSFICTIESD